jgi:hypothetical protein
VAEGVPVNAKHMTLARIYNGASKGVRDSLQPSCAFWIPPASVSFLNKSKKIRATKRNINIKLPDQPVLDGPEFAGSVALLRAANKQLFQNGMPRDGCDELKGKV